MSGNSGEDDDTDKEERITGRRDGSIVLKLLRLITYGVYAFVMKVLGYNVRRLENKIDQRLNKVENRLERFGKRLAVIGLLITVLVIFAIILSIVWLFVGVVWLVNNTVLSLKPLVFILGFIVGYIACLLTGVIYMRR